MPVTPDIPKAEALVIELTNAFRATSKLQGLRSEPALTTAARDYARFLAATTIFSHEADGRRPIERIKAAGYKPCTTAENLAWMSDTRGFATGDLATRMVDGWKGSPPHRKNMELPLVTETAVAIVKARGEEKYISVQLFGRPASLQFSFEIENGGGRAVAYALAGNQMRIEPNTMVRHTICEPGEVAFVTRPGSFRSKPVTARYAASDGQVYRLTAGPSGEVAIAVGSR